jgi:hypothetical protein
LKSGKSLPAVFSEDFCTTPENLSIKRKRGISLAVLKAFDEF